MATTITCDHEDHKDGDPVRAVARISLQKADEKSKNTINVVKSKDACGDHVGAIAEKAYNAGVMDPLFHAVRIDSLR